MQALEYVRKNPDDQAVIVMPNSLGMNLANRDLRAAGAKKKELARIRVTEAAFHYKNRFAGIRGMLFVDHAVYDFDEIDSRVRKVEIRTNPPGPGSGDPAYIARKVRAGMTQMNIDRLLASLNPEREK
jgi:hypothetical protein